jgi:hypothetical protein
MKHNDEGFHPTMFGSALADNLATSMNVETN